MNSPDAAFHCASIKQPAPLQPGDKIRFLSPASPPIREDVLRRAAVFESWGLKVDFADHAFHQFGFLAGSDDERLSDFNEALRDPSVRAIVTTRGGKGSYRIADRLDFAAASRDPKYVVGFSDITILHLSLSKHCGLVGIHGALVNGPDGDICDESAAALRTAMMTSDDISLMRSANEPTAALTTSGIASGRLIGGNLAMLSTALGWALPDLTGAILLIEAVNMGLGQLDRELTALHKGGWLSGLAGIAVGQFTDFKDSQGFTVIDILRDHLAHCHVPVLGGLPLGHGDCALAAPVGAMATLNASDGCLTIAR